MGCSCGGKRKPAGQVRAPNSVPPPTQQKAPTPPPQPSGSGQKAATGQRQTFSLMTPDRLVRTFGSRLEAEAARVRAGGVGTIS